MDSTKLIEEAQKKYIHVGRCDYHDMSGKRCEEECYNTDMYCLVHEYLLKLEQEHEEQINGIKNNLYPNTI